MRVARAIMRAQPAAATRRAEAYHASERPIEGGLGRVAHLRGDAGDAGVRVAQELGSELDPPVGEVGHRRLADQRVEAVDERGAGEADGPSERVDGPIAIRLGVESLQRAAHVRIAQAGEPAGVLGRQELHEIPQHLDEHELGEAREQRRRAGARARGLRDRELQEPVQGGRPVPSLAPPAQHLRQAGGKRIEHGLVAMHEAAHEPGHRSPSPVPHDRQLLRRDRGQQPADRRRHHRVVAGQHVRVAVRVHDDVAFVEALGAVEQRDAASRRDRVEGDQRRVSSRSSCAMEAPVVRARPHGAVSSV